MKIIIICLLTVFFCFNIYSTNKQVFDWAKVTNELADPENDQKGNKNMDISKIKYLLDKGNIYMIIETTEKPIFGYSVFDIDFILTLKNNKTVKLDVNIRSDGTYDLWSDLNNDGKVDYEKEKISVSDGSVIWKDDVKFILPIKDKFDTKSLKITKVAFNINSWPDIYESKE